MKSAPPLNGVLGLADLLIETPLTEEQRDMVRIMKNLGSILMGVLNDILDYSKIEAGMLDMETAPFDLKGILEEISAIMTA